jgi:hypothetical protein
MELVSMTCESMQKCIFKLHIPGLICIVIVLLLGEI